MQVIAAGLNLASSGGSDRLKKLRGIMKTEFLTGLGLEKEAIDKIMAENGKDIEREKAKAATVQTELDKLEADAEAANAKLAELEKLAGDNKALADELAAMKKANDERIAAEKAKTEDDALTAKILEAIGDKKFTNDLTKAAVINEVKAAHKADGTKGLAAHFEEITKDKEGIFANPNTFTPNVGKIGDVVVEAYTREQLAAMTPDEINKNWDAVKVSLK